MSLIFVNLDAYNLLANANPAWEILFVINMNLKL